MSDHSFSQAVDQRLRQGPTAHFSSQTRLAEQVLAGGASPVLLFGAGGLGRKTAVGLREEGVRVDAFVDNKQLLAGTEIEGIPVVTLAEALAAHGPDAVVVVAIWRAFATETMQDRLRALRSAGFRKILPFYYLFWQRPAVFLPHWSIEPPDRVRAAADAVLTAAELFKDARSREEFIHQLHWRLDPEAAELKKTDDEAIYFAEALYQPIPDEAYVDCGGFDGDTLKDFVTATRGQFASAHVFEPDPANFAKLKDTVASLPGDSASRVTIHPCAVGSRSEELVLDSAGNMSSRLSAEGTTRVRCETLDALLANERATFVKMDIEGAELAALRGAETLIRQQRPILTVCLYHQQDHLWVIPLQLASLVTEYDFHLRTYGQDGWDLVLYAIPHERRKAASRLTS